MKKYTFVLLLLLIPSICFGAIGATCVWEVRTTGAQENGGGYTSGGTDYSQQDAAQLSLTDLVSADPWTTITSVTGGFTAAMVGNIIHITSSAANFTPGWYEIITRVDTNTITVDRACGSTGAGAAGVGAVGGAFLLGGALDDEFFESTVAGNTVYIKTGTYTLGEAISLAVGIGTAVSPLNIIGYVTNRTTIPYTTNRPTLICGANAVLFGPYTRVYNLIFTTTHATGIVLDNPGNLLFNCKITNTTNAASAVKLDGINGSIVYCDITSTGTTSKGVEVNAYGTQIFYSYIHDSVTCISVGSGPTAIVGNVIEGCTTGIATGGTAGNFIANNTIYGAAVPAGTGISGTTSYANVVINNIISYLATGASWTTQENASYWDYNNYYNNTTADRSNVPIGANDIDADPAFVDAATGDFRVGTNMKAVGFPGTLVNIGLSANCVGYTDMGAVQRIEPAATGGGGAWVF